MIALKVTENGGTQRLIKRLNRIKSLPSKVSDGVREWGDILVRDLKEAAHDANIQSFEGTLYGNGIRWDQPKNGLTGKLFMRKYGIQLDSMTPHVVSIKKSRTKLVRWAAQAQSQTLRAQAAIVQSTGRNYTAKVFVRPHPFILTGWRRARPKLQPILRRTTRATVTGGSTL